MPKKKGDKNMKLVLAEKPSVAQSIAKALGANERFDGYLEGNEYSRAVTPQVRQTGNRLSGLAGTAYASLLA